MPAFSSQAGACRVSPALGRHSLGRQRFAILSAGRPFADTMQLASSAVGLRWSALAALR